MYSRVAALPLCRLTVSRFTRKSLPWNTVSLAISRLGQVGGASSFGLAAEIYLVAQLLRRQARSRGVICAAAGVEHGARGA